MVIVWAWACSTGQGWFHSTPHCHSSPISPPMLSCLWGFAFNLLRVPPRYHGLVPCTVDLSGLRGGTCKRAAGGTKGDERRSSVPSTHVPKAGSRVPSREGPASKTRHAKQRASLEGSTDRWVQHPRPCQSLAADCQGKGRKGMACKTVCEPGGARQGVQSNTH